MANGPSRHIRFLKKNGEFNVVRRGMPRAYFYDLYHWLIVIRWRIFLPVVIVLYGVINAGFAVLYLLGGDCVSGVEPGSFWDMFFFSVQTISTIGYGGMSPTTMWSNSVASVEAISGVLMTALLTGLMFSKFSLPTARVVFTTKASIRQFRGNRVLMFRMANMRANQIVDATVNVLMAGFEVVEGGQTFRRLQDLTVTRRRTSMFALSWTVTHIIDEDSPLYACEVEQWREREIELIVSLSGIDGTFGQTIQARHSYTINELVFDHAFDDIISPQDDGHILIDYRKFQGTHLIEEHIDS